MDNIKGVVEDGLCVGCGTCAGVCPVCAVEMRVSKGLFLPVVDEVKCTRCGLCVRCCPGFSVDFELLNSFVFGVQPDDVLLGNFGSCYVGHSCDVGVRFDSSSGGVVTHLLVFALEKGLIDGAVVTRMNKDNPLVSESFIARTREEIVSASKSKYCPTCVNEFLRLVSEEKGKFAFVGLPCQIHGVRKAEMQIEALREKIVLHIGIMCSHTVSYYGTDFLLKRLKVLPGQVEEISYRGSGWPGSMLIKIKNCLSISVPYVGAWNAYWPIFSCFFFTPRRCLMCPDETNELADVSFGDAWLPELKNERKGESIIVTRTAKGEEILNLASSAGFVFLKPVDSNKVKQSQAVPLKFKKLDLKARLNIMETQKQKMPSFHLKPRFLFSCSIFSFLRNFFVLFNVKASEKESLKKVLLFVPFPLMRLYYGLYKFLCYI